MRAEAAVLEEQKAAFETVIRVFDPSSGSSFVGQPKKRDRSTPSRRVTDLLKGRNVRHGVLELLRDTEEPVLASQLSERFLVREGIEELAEGIASNLAGRFSGLLESMEQSGLVRSSGAADGRRRLWEIAR
ncbi:hypothetical protein GOA89_32600 [Sinorhizobium meliloti]|nr:hypothetical protein [Sinorhizobium meliloti]MDW9850861.1 hypothetical protein [Sinorhizobium meliloti]MDX0147645.1 hypothetical protein [Sinorhizobium meliloti]MDX0153914.1 hypothetical protein [Sinorhizobium meliloti]MDX0172826.1 hypothetical protein [Sinorhizobium meliloti]